MSSSTQDTVDTAARVARLPRRGQRAPDAPQRDWRTRLETVARTRAFAIAMFGLLLAVSLGYKVRGLGTAYWIDEGLSVGIGSHPLGDIPAVLKLDGSPPLYYALLHVWMSIFGTSEWATQSMSTIIGVLCVPAAFWAGNVMFGRRVAWAAAAIAAVNPFLTLHSYEARMYALLTLLGLLASTAFALAFVDGRRRWVPVFGVLLALMLYTHNWALFFGAACVAALAWLALRQPTQRRRLVRDGAIGLGVTGLLYAPWLPALAYQIRHTGAPWSQRPMFDELIFGTGITVGGRGPSVALALVAGVAISGFVAAKRTRDLRMTQTLLVLFAGTVIFAFLASQLSPAWAQRYLAISLGPLMLFAAATFPNAGRMGMWALAIFLAINVLPQPISKLDPSDEKAVAEIVGPWTRPGDLVVVTHPERVPIMRHYLGPQLHYADLFGPVKDPTYFNWSDALQRVEHVRVTRNLEPLLDSVPVGGRVMLVRAIVDKKANSWKAPWTKRVSRQARRWAHALNADHRFRVVISAPNPYASLRFGVRAVLYQRIRR